MRIFTRHFSAYTELCWKILWQHVACVQYNATQPIQSGLNNFHDKIFLYVTQCIGYIHPQVEENLSQSSVGKCCCTFNRIISTVSCLGELIPVYMRCFSLNKRKYHCMKANRAITGAGEVFNNLIMCAYILYMK